MAIERPKDLTVDKAWGMYLRALADLENMRKRHPAEIREAREKGRSAALLKMLPIVDSLEAGNQQASQYRGRGVGGAVNHLKEGFAVVTKQARSTLRSAGVNPFDCQSKPFDPICMDAIARQPTTDPPGLVFAEVKRGYTIDDKILRPAQVAVTEALLLEQENSNG